MDRGICGFAVKAKNAQVAGAVGVIIGNNAAGFPPPGMGGADPTVVIPQFRSPCRTPTR
ncbi:MAG: PA domain-containing protein [Candidatus Solibacter sp.]